MHLKKPAIFRTVALLLVLTISSCYYIKSISHKEPIRLGAIFSLTGDMAVSEAPLADAVRMAVDEINAGGGLLGRRVELAAIDAKSDWGLAAKEAERLIAKENVKALVACWTSACRKAVKPVVEKYGTIMFYPGQYEGMEESPDIIYTGSAPNQQIVPGTIWMTEKFGRKVFLAGSEHIFPRTANVIIKNFLKATGGSISGESYIPLGSADVNLMVDAIAKARPEIILNTISGNSNLDFFKALQDRGLQDIPVMSFSIPEGELVQLGADKLKNHYGAWSYFSSLQNEENKGFVNGFNARFGAGRKPGDPFVSAYCSVLLWAEAVRETNSLDKDVVYSGLLRQTLKAPGGMLSIDRTTRHLWKMARVVKVREDGRYEEVWSSSAPVRPSPFPMFRTKSEWNELLNKTASGGGR